MTQTVLILGGSGRIGTHAAAAFWDAGWAVRHFDRKTDNMTQAARGVDVIVNGMNPANYHNWAKTIPAITHQVIAAAKASGATVIIPGNVYNFGDRGGQFDETTPQTPNTRKGQIRKEMEQAYRDAGVPTIILRAGNFLDPNRNGDIQSLLILKSAHKGIVTTLGDPDVPQAHAYLPDWARAAVMLAEKRSTLDVFEDIPFPGHTFTMRDLAVAVESRTGKPMRLKRFPWWSVTLMAPFWELMREFREMRYLNDMPHWLGTDKFDRLLPEFQATDLQTAMLAGLAGDINPDQSVGTGRKTIAAQ
ncbi:NAD-dependent epimerase/dehydratase family protein [Yoonia sp. 208BN28-4]|uniref:NAD-dependent epimerase/dehydratase family protein n=1 Tax=Yoonia sp. 208BN28-4 TaxID=3126505 RepID=UPI0030B2BFB9